MDTPLAQSSRTARDRELAALVTRMAQRDEDALNTLYDCTVGHMHALACAVLSNREDAEEVVCDLYVQAWQRAHQYCEERGSVLAWLATLCRSRALDALRRRQVRQRGRVDDARGAAVERETLAPDSLLALLQEGDALHAALGGLSDLRRQLVALSYFRGLSHRELAESVGLPLGTVKSHLRRALATLRESLEL